MLREFPELTEKETAVLRSRLRRENENKLKNLKKSLQGSKVFFRKDLQPLKGDIRAIKAAMAQIPEDTAYNNGLHLLDTETYQPDVHEEDFRLRGKVTQEAGEFADPLELMILEEEAELGLQAPNIFKADDRFEDESILEEVEQMEEDRDLQEFARLTSPRHVHEEDDEDQILAIVEKRPFLLNEVTAIFRQRTGAGSEEARRRAFGMLQLILALVKRLVARNGQDYVREYLSKCPGVLANLNFQAKREIQIQRTDGREKRPVGHILMAIGFSHYDITAGRCR